MTYSYDIREIGAAVASETFDVWERVFEWQLLKRLLPCLGGVSPIKFL